jgi:hypothetical protein
MTDFATPWFCTSKKQKSSATHAVIISQANLQRQSGGQKSYWSRIKETQAGQTRTERTGRRETMLYVGGAN